MKTVSASSLNNKRVLIGVTGGIAAYKTPELVRRVRDYGAEVRVVMTRGACEFITPLTMQAVSGNPVHTELLDTEAEAGMGHIELARWADLIIIAPATADALARFASGRGDDLLSTLLLASVSPKLLAPAMNQAMWSNAANQKNVAELERLGFISVGPATGGQACGDVGSGRMSEPMDIVDAASTLFETGSLAGKYVLITAGPTREALDPVRYISNYSSGKMGFALANAAVEAGAKVKLIAGPVNLETPEKVERENVQTAQEMHDAVHQSLSLADIVIATAAVADFRPAECENEKIKKTTEDNEMLLQLVKNPDIVASIKQSNFNPYVVGFAAETNDIKKHARQKLERKGLEMIVANDVSRSDIGFGSNDNEVIVFTQKDEIAIPRSNKSVLARQLLALIAERAESWKSDILIKNEF